MTIKKETKADRIGRLCLGLAQTGRIRLEDCRRGVGEDTAKSDLKLIRRIWGLQPLGSGKHTHWVVDSTRSARGVLDRLGLRIGRELLEFLDKTPLIDGPQRAAEHQQPRPGRYTQLDKKLFALHEPRRRYAHSVETLHAVLDALLNDWELTFRYEDQPLRVQALTLVVYRRALYCMAQLPDGARRLYALDRMRGAESTRGVTRSYPEDWDPAQHWRHSFGNTPTGKPEWIVLRFDAAGAKYVRPRQYHPTQQLSELSDGGVELRMKVTGRELARFVLEWGPRVQVIEPAWLREEVVKQLGEALGLYRDPGQS